MIRLVLIVALVAACTGGPPAASPTGAPPQTAAPTVAASTPTAAPPNAAPTPTAAATPAAPPTGGPAVSPQPFQIEIGTDTSGTYLVTPDGYSLYTFDNDSPGESSCDGNCAETWPPFQTGGMSVGGGEGVNGTFGTTTRGDGTPQITYNDAPLYFYSGDASPGDTNGDDIGGVWHLAQP